MSGEAVTHVIFDFDGLLVDTEPIYTLANQKALSKWGKTFTPQLKAGQMGRKHEEAIRWLLEQVGLWPSVSVEEYAKDYDACLFASFREAGALPGAERLVRHLVDKGVPVAICSGSSSIDFPHKAENHRHWLDLIELKVLTGDDPAVKRGKPHPDGFLETMNRFASPPASASNVLVLEDAPNGVAAAVAAGMRVVWVPDAMFRPDDGNKAASVDQLLDSLEQFAPENFGLPAF